MRRTLPFALALGAAMTPASVMAAELCAHPFDSAGPCLQTYTVIAIPYLAILSTYAAAVLVILRPRFESGRVWAAALCATPLVNYAGVLAAFTLTSALGMTNYPHDTTPYYYIDWGVMGLALAIQTLYVGAILWRFARQSRPVEA